MALRTPQQFDDWFRRSGGDPWGYDSAFVQERLEASLSFIARYVPPDFSGTFIELAAFNGSFTKRLAAAFPQARIAASDISPVAVEMARAAVTDFRNVDLACADMATFELPAGAVPPIEVLLLECIYYLPEAERRPAIERAIRVAGRPNLFISCPITGADPYPTERRLMVELRRLDYRCGGAHVLNYLPRWHRIGSRLASIAAARRWTARQVIYRFVPS